MSEKTLYMEAYAHYRALIEDGTLAPGMKMPSLRTCCSELGISKTTAESAYFQLAADGYVISRERSGYYVSRGAVKIGDVPKDAKQWTRKGDESSTETKFTTGTKNDTGSKTGPGSEPEPTARYDFTKVGEDASAFCFDLWQKYMKSAMRDTGALISYGEPQGERKLREELVHYVRERRNIYCTAEHIVIGASTQALLMLLLAMLKGEGVRTASVPTTSFSRYARVFSDYGFEVGYRNKEADLIYVSPSHMTAWGDVMSLKRRYELLEHSRNGHLVIEDDYLNDFVYSKQACPSLYALGNGEHVVYIGSFSRVLLPSIRISYMILPKELLPVYARIRTLYDQTASKTEQLSLLRFLRDHQLDRHIKKIRRLYGVKRDLMRQVIEAFCTDERYTPLIGESGTELAVRVKDVPEPEIRKRLREHEVACRIVKEREGSFLLIFSCGMIELNKMEELRERIAPDHE